MPYKAKRARRGKSPTRENKGLMQQAGQPLVPLLAGLRAAWKKQQRREREAWLAMSQEEQAAAGGYQITTAGQTRGGLLRQWEAVGFPIKLQVGLLWTFLVRNLLSQRIMGHLREQLFQQQMAGVSGEFGKRGLMSSAMYGQAAATAATGAQRTRVGLEAQESAQRRTLAFQSWREQEQLKIQRAQLRQRGSELSAQRAAQREQRQQGFSQALGQLDASSIQNFMARYMGAVGPGPGGGGAGGGGWQGRMGVQQQNLGWRSASAESRARRAASPWSQALQQA